MTLEKDSFRLKISGSGKTNNVPFDATGEGEGNAFTGRLRFRTTFSDVPKGIDPFANLLGVLILETAVFAREVEGAMSLMTLAGGIFEFTQEIKGNGISASSHGRVTQTDKQEFTWVSKAEAQLMISKVNAIEPFEAVMIPQGPGKIIEVIKLRLVENGQSRDIHAIRNFTFTPNSQLREFQLRHIDLKLNVQGLNVGVDIASAVRLFKDSYKQ